MRNWTLKSEKLLPWSKLWRNRVIPLASISESITRILQNSTVNFDVIFGNLISGDIRFSGEILVQGFEAGFCVDIWESDCHYWRWWWEGSGSLFFNYLEDGVPQRAINSVIERGELCGVVVMVYNSKRNPRLEIMGFGMIDWWIFFCSHGLASCGGLIMLLWPISSLSKHQECMSTKRSYLTIDYL